MSKEETERAIRNVQSYEFNEEINQLSIQLKDKIISLRKDYRDLKIFKNENDIENAREKLLVFIRKLITDTNSLIIQVERNFNRNQEMLRKEEEKKEADK